MAIFCVILISFLATEVSFDATAEYLIASEEAKRVQAYYAAKSGVKLSLLRINLYQEVKSTMGEMAKQAGQEGLLEMVWQMPFYWPPSALLPEEVSRVDRELISEVEGESLMEGRYRADITSEAAKLDLNDLVSPSKSLAEITRKQLIRLLENKLNADDDWAREYRGLRAEEIVNNIIDWMDADSDGRNSGDEKQPYAELQAGDAIPPNQPLKTLEELHMIEGVTDEIYAYLSPLVTVYGVKGVQVNRAPADILRSIDPQITDEAAKAIIKRRDDKQLGGPFKDEKDFLAFISGPEVGINTASFNQDKVPLIFDNEFSFRIRSSGEAGSSSKPTTREIIAIVYDFDKVKERLGKIVAEDKAKDNPNPSPSPSPGPGGPGPSPSPSPAPAGSKNPPSIVYWVEY
ncbi:MAG TPA: type II secretion system protein GspK [Bdellovibrionales bacterium]|nr:type II secretion system protein GspK [Bdellovibrionales bacterium]